MDIKTFVARVMKSLPELEPEDKELPGTKASFEKDIEVRFQEGWTVQDTISHIRLTEHIDCWTKDESGAWVPKDPSAMIPEDVALSRSAAIALRYRKNNQQREQLIQAAVNLAILDGWKIQRRTILDRDNKCCCALGALVIHESPGANGKWPNGESSIMERAATLLSTSYEWVWSFAKGFDYEPAAIAHHWTINDVEAYNLGQKFRVQLGSITTWKGLPDPPDLTS